MKAAPVIRLSLCMIVRNEAGQLARALASARPVVDEMIVVDTGSTDDTVSAAAAAGARVFHFAWNADFAAARNASLAHASGDWILSLDADEELEPISRPALHALLQTAAADGLSVRIRNLAGPEDVVPEYFSQAVRLFRNRPEYRFEGRLHEQISPAILRHGGQLAHSPVGLRHFGYMRSQVQGQADRSQRNVALLELAARDAPDDLYVRAKLGCAYFYANRFDQARPVLEQLLAEARAAELSPETLQEARLALATLASQTGDLDLAEEQARRALAAGGDLAPQAKARLVLGLTILRRGEQQWRTFQGAPEAWVQISATFAEAAAQLEDLRAHPGLRPAARAAAEEWLAVCQALRAQLAAAEPEINASLLQRLLTADDLPAALEKMQPAFSPSLVELIQTQAAAARADGQAELADGLENLKDYIAQTLAGK